MNYNKTFIIAEAGVNHNGSLEMAFQLIDKKYIQSHKDLILYPLTNATTQYGKSHQSLIHHLKSPRQNP